MSANVYAPCVAQMNSVRPARIFVGLKIEDQIARELDRIAHQLEDLPEVRLVAADDIHLTLVPPWEESATPDAIGKLNQVAAQFGIFILMIQHVGYGPDLRWPRLLWADCTITDELAALRHALLTVYNRTEEKPFLPHITLARIRRNGRRIVHKYPIDKPLVLSQRIGSIELFQSPAQGERGYRILVSVPLSGAPIT
jgi:2'-5' RNA ligase